MSLHVLNHDNGVINNQAHREHDGEQRKQVDAEAKQLHQEDRTDQGDRDGHNRHDHRAQGAEKQVDNQHHDQQGLGQSDGNLAYGAVDVLG